MVGEFLKEKLGVVRLPEPLVPVKVDPVNKRLGAAELIEYKGR